MLPVHHNQASRRYLLRWRFEYADGKPARYGMWSTPANKADFDSQAWTQNKGAIARAMVEGKDIRTKEVKVLLDCPGVDFVNFEWNALAAFNPYSIGGACIPRTTLAGLQIRSRYAITSVDETGFVEAKPRPPEDMAFHYATFGR